MSLDFRKFARIAAVAMAASGAWSACARLLMVLALPPTAAVSVIVLAILSVVTSAPLIVLLWLLSGADVTVALSKRQQYVACALTLLRAISVVLLVVQWWRHGINPNAGRLIASGMGFRIWFAQSRLRFFVSDVLQLMEGLTFVLFLFALSRRSGTTADAEASRSRPRLLRVLAIASMFVSGLLMLAGTFYPYFQLRSVSANISVPVVRSLRRIALFSLPAFIAPWMIYQSARSVRTTEPV